MPKKIPSIKAEASDQARAVYAFMINRKLSMSEWTQKAGLSVNILGNLFSGRNQSLQYETLKKLAEAANVSPDDITTTIFDPSASPTEQFSAGHAVSINSVRGAISMWAVKHGIQDPLKAVKEIEAIIYDVEKEGIYS